jgi:hypothetical protein
MDSISKGFSLILVVILAVSSLIIVKPALAQSIPKPSVPEFTVHLVGPSFTRNTTYSLDSNTGQIVANIGYTNQYSYVILTIKNQPFDSSHGSLYYNVQIKNQNTPYRNWTIVTYDGPKPKQFTDSDFTNISLRIEGQWSLASLAETQTDIQVQAMLGSFYYGPSAGPPFFSIWQFSGVTSDWSDTQTASIPANIPLSPTPAPSSSTPTPITSYPTATANQSGMQLNWLELGGFAVLGVVVALLIAVIAFMRRRIRVLELKQDGTKESS